MLPDDEDGDSEHPDAASTSQRHHIQRLIMHKIDDRRVAAVLHKMGESCDVAGLRRLDELQHRDQDHTWMWALSPHRGPVMESGDYLEALRLRLGVAGPTDAAPCALCGSTVMDSPGAHALCCARAESTRGHNNVTRQLADEISGIDNGLELEPMGLVPGTLLRPADILTGALGGGLTALDIGIASPDAVGAGADCTESMVSRKLEKYAPHMAALDRQNIDYRPLVFSCYGRLHPDTTATLRTLAKRVARRRGCSAGEWRFRRLRPNWWRSAWCGRVGPTTSLMTKMSWIELSGIAADSGDLQPPLGGEA